MLRVAASRSYGKLLHPIDMPTDARARTLAWDWRVDRAPDADLRQRAGDDVAVRVCAFFDWPIERLSLLDRTRLVAAEALAGQEIAPRLPDADRAHDEGRVPLRAARHLGAVSEAARAVRRLHAPRAPGTRCRHKRAPPGAVAAFADEWRDGDQLPPVRAVVIGSDTDNTGGEGLAFVRAIDLMR